MLHPPSQTNHAFQDIWRQLANYWPTLAPGSQLSQPGSNSTNTEGRVKICSSSDSKYFNNLAPGPGLVWVRWWHCMWVSVSVMSCWCQDDTMIAPEMTQVRWHMTDDRLTLRCAHISHSLLLSPFSLWRYRLSPSWPFVLLLESVSGCFWCWGKMEEWMFPPENRNKSTRVGQMPGGWARTAAGFYLELFSWEIYWL